MTRSFASGFDLKNQKFLVQWVFFWAPFFGQAKNGTKNLKNKYLAESAELEVTMKFNLKNIVRTNIWDLKPYSSARSEFDLYSSSKNDLTLIDANENPEQLTLNSDIITQNLNRYPDPLQSELKAEIAKQKEISVDQVFIGNGSDEAIDLLYRIFCEPGKDKVLICPPTYGMYEVSAAINDIGIVEVPLKEDFELDLETIRTQVQNDDAIKIIWICSPNNPTGNALLKADLKHDWQAENYTLGGMMDMPFNPEFESEMLENQRKLDQLFGSFNGIVVIDEAYQDFTENLSFIKRLEEYPNLVVMQTMSKAQGLAGARVGFAFASPEIIELFNKTKPPYNVNALSQGAALQVLKEEEAKTKSITQIINNREWLERELEGFEFVQKIYPSEANFILVAVDDADTIYNYLKDQGIIVRNRSSQIANTIRLTVGTRYECEQLIDKLKSI